MSRTVLLEVQEKDDQVCMSKDKFEDLISELESLVETVEILSDPETMKQIRKSEKEIKEGKTFKFRKRGDLIKLLRD